LLKVVLSKERFMLFCLLGFIGDANCVIRLMHDDLAIDCRLLYVVINILNLTSMETEFLSVDEKLK